METEYKPIYKIAGKIQYLTEVLPQIETNTILCKTLTGLGATYCCHSLRKTFGRQVYNMNSDNAELALVKLMELFNHSSVAITKRYLGLRQEEILQTYDCLSF